MDKEYLKKIRFKSIEHAEDVLKGKDDRIIFEILGIKTFSLGSLFGWAETKEGAEFWNKQFEKGKLNSKGRKIVEEMISVAKEVKWKGYTEEVS